MVCGLIRTFVIAIAGVHLVLNPVLTKAKVDGALTQSTSVEAKGE